MHEIAAALALLQGAKRPVAFTGAGMSAESGVPTFRGAQGGLWSEYDAEQLATPDAYRADPALVWGWYVWRMALAHRAAPHAGHLALAEMQRRWPEFMVATQNVDDLHERAGSRNIVHLHGELFAHRCFACSRPYQDFEAPNDAADHPKLRLMPSRCPHCGGSIRPGVVWFGEPLPQDAWWKAKRRIGDADVLLVVGTSGVVEPAASLVRHAQYCGAKIIEINPEPSAQTSRADIHLQCGAASALRQLADGLA